VVNPVLLATLPALHAVHEPEPSTEENVPDEQSEHAIVELEYFPIAQFVQPTDPIPVVIFPAGHAEHTDSCAEAAYVPALQLVHVESPAELVTVPALQVLHV
jgi:hypothetical protein